MAKQHAVGDHVLVRDELDSRTYRDGFVRAVEPGRLRVNLPWGDEWVPTARISWWQPAAEGDGT